MVASSKGNDGTCWSGAAMAPAAPATVPPAASAPAAPAVPEALRKLRRLTRPGTGSSSRSGHQAQDGGWGAGAGAVAGAAHDQPRAGRGHAVQAGQVLQGHAVAVQDQRGLLEVGVGARVGAEGVGAERAQVALADQPAGGGQAEAGLVDVVLGVLVGVGRGAPAVLPAGPGDHGRPGGDAAVAGLEGLEVGHGDLVVGVGGGLAADVQDHRRADEVAGGQLVGAALALVEVAGGAVVGAGVLPLLDVLEVEAVLGHGEHRGQGELGVAGEHRGLGRAGPAARPRRPRRCRRPATGGRPAARPRPGRRGRWRPAAAGSGHGEASSGWTTRALPPPRRTGSAAAWSSPWRPKAMPAAAPISGGSGAVAATTRNCSPRAWSWAASGLARKAGSASPGSLLRWDTRGAAIASGRLAPSSRCSTRIWSTVVMMVAPPGDPMASTGRPSRSTIVGLIEDRGRLPGAGRLGSGTPATSGSGSKSVSSLLSRNP